MRHVLVELVVLLLGDLRLRPRPQRRRLVDLLVLVGQDLRFRRGIPSLLLHEDRDGDVVGVLAQDLAQPDPRQQLVLVRTQVQDDVGAAGLLAHRLDGVVALAGALPADAVLGGEAGAPGHAASRGRRR